MNRLLLMITMSLIAQLNFAQNAPTSTYEGPIIIDKPVSGGIGLKVEGGYTWLHNDDNGVESSVLKLGIYKNSNTPNFQIYSADGGGHNYMTTHGGRWGSHFRWTRNSNDGRQFMASIGGDDNYGQYFRLYGTAPDTANVVKIQLRSKGDSYLNTNGNFGLGTNAPTEKLDVNGGGRFRNVPPGSGNLLMIDGTGKLWQKTIPDFLYENGLDGGGGLGDNLGNHCAAMNLDMKNFDIDNVKDIKGVGDININSGDFLHLDAANGITLDADKNSALGVGIGMIPEADVYLSINGTTRVREVLKVENAAFALELKPEEIKGTGNINMNTPDNININSGDFLDLKATNGINLNSEFMPLKINDIHKQSVGIGGEPNGIPGALNVTLDVHKNDYDAPIRVRDLPVGNFPIVTVDDTGVLHKYDIMAIIAGLQAQIDELRMRIEILENP